PGQEPGLDAGAAQQRAAAVDQDLAGVGGRGVGAVDHPAPPGPGQRLLGELLGLGLVAGQQQAQPAQPDVLAGEELAELDLVDGHGVSLLTNLTPWSGRKVAARPDQMSGNGSWRGDESSSTEVTHLTHQKPRRPW